MIKKFNKQDIDRVMELWLSVNTTAHSFIDGEYWIKNYEGVKEMILIATILVYEEENQILGFMGLMDDYIAGLFVSNDSQSKGIGKELLDVAKTMNDKLELLVYQENERAVQFYVRESFKVIEESLDSQTGRVELKMRWMSEFY